jgi:hypothetical protein
MCANAHCGSSEAVQAQLLLHDTTENGVPHIHRQFQSCQLVDTSLQSSLRRLIPLYSGSLGDLNMGYVCSASRPLGTGSQ